MGFFSSWFQQPAPAASTSGAAVTSPTEAAPGAPEEKRREVNLWSRERGYAPIEEAIFAGQALPPELRQQLIDLTYAQQRGRGMDSIYDEWGTQAEGRLGQDLGMFDSVRDRRADQAALSDEELWGQTVALLQQIERGGTDFDKLFNAGVQIGTTAVGSLAGGPAGAALGAGFSSKALGAETEDALKAAATAYAGGQFNAPELDMEYLAAADAAGGLLPEFGMLSGGGPLSALGGTPLYSTPASTTYGLDGTPSFSTPAMTTVAGEGLPFNLQTGALTPGMLAPGAVIPSAPTPEVDSPGITTRDLYKYAKIANSIESMFGSPQDAPQRAGGQSDQQYADQLANYMGLDAETMAGYGLMPGSPQYYEYIMAQADTIIDQVLAGVDVDSADLAAQLRGKTAQEMQALQRALYVRGQMQTLVGSGSYADPVSGREEEVISPDGMFNPGMAGYQRGLARNVDTLAGLRGVEAADYLDTLLGRSPDMYGMQAAADAQYQQALLEQQEDPRRRRGMFSGF